MILSHLMRKHILTKGPITTEDIEQNIEAVECALDHGTNDAFILRSDLLTLAKALRTDNVPIGTPVTKTPQTPKSTKKLQNTPVSCSSDDTENLPSAVFMTTDKTFRQGVLVERNRGSVGLFDSANKKMAPSPEKGNGDSTTGRQGKRRLGSKTEGMTVGTRKVTTVRQPKRLKLCGDRETDTAKQFVYEKNLANRKKAQKKQLKERKADAGFFTGKLSQSPVQAEDLPGAPKNGFRRRLVGQNAASIAQTKDDTQRSSVKQLYNIVDRCNAQGSYANEEMNETLPTTTFVTFVIDEVSPWPARSRGISRRDQPMIRCLGLNDNTKIGKVVEYLSGNVEDIQPVENKHEFEIELFGERGQMVSKKKKKKMVDLIAISEEKIENDCKQVQSTDSICSPIPEGECRDVLDHPMKNIVFSDNEEGD